MTHPLEDHVSGPRGEAHRVPDDRLRASLSGDEVATIAYWWLHIPGSGIIVAHAGAEPESMPAVASLEVIIPAAGSPDSTDTFALGLITLADIPGVPPARRAWPWMTHALIVFTLDTTRGPVPPDAPLPWPFLQPHNLSVQFQVDNDDQARHVAHDVVVGVVHGMLPPEIQAFVPERHKMMTLAPLYTAWQDTVRATAEHLRTGGSHAEPHP